MRQPLVVAVMEGRPAPETGREARSRGRDRSRFYMQEAREMGPPPPRPSSLPPQPAAAAGDSLPEGVDGLHGFNRVSPPSSAPAPVPAVAVRAAAGAPDPPARDLAVVPNHSPVPGGGEGARDLNEETDPPSPPDNPGPPPGGGPPNGNGDGDPGDGPVYWGCRYCGEMFFVTENFSPDEHFEVCPDRPEPQEDAEERSVTPRGTSREPPTNPLDDSDAEHSLVTETESRQAREELVRQDLQNVIGRQSSLGDISQAVSSSPVPVLSTEFRPDEETMRPARFAALQASTAVKPEDSVSPTAGTREVGSPVSAGAARTVNAPVFGNVAPVRPDSDVQPFRPFGPLLPSHAARELRRQNAQGSLWIQSLILPSGLGSTITTLVLLAPALNSREGLDLDLEVVSHWISVPIFWIVLTQLSLCGQQLYWIRSLMYRSCQR